MATPIEHLDVSAAITERETEWIPMSDGRRLAVRLFLPRTALDEPVPAILEYIPYRRRDGTRLGDEGMHRWFAAHGFACARVDIAGAGDSDGIIEDEYALREQDDGLEVIAWLAAQPWCTGKVGMIGISWGGFNGLQIAARRPPALAAVISLCSTVDRYHGDVHYTGGCLNEENMEWGGYFFTMQGFPPDPEVVGADRWRTLWRQRIEAASLPPADWLEHQRRDAFWEHGSVVEDYSAIEVPVLAVSGWADGYTGVVFDLVEHLSSPCKGIVGPWGHKYPQDGIPGPAIGFLEEATRWWDRWLRGIDTGVEADPDLRLYLQDPHYPETHIDERPGTWVAMADWSPPTPTVARVADGALRLGADHAGGTGTASINSPVTVGSVAGQWCAYGLGKIAPELPGDQRVEDAGSLTYDTGVLDRTITVAGRPALRLRVSSDRPVAQVVARLCDVRPDGSVERLSYGVLNLCHRNSHATPEALVPGELYDVVVPLKAMAQQLVPGHRLRLALSTTYWPMIWPSPEPVTLTVHDAGTWLELPVHQDMAALPDDLFGPPTDARAGSVTVIRPGAELRQVVVDVGVGRTECIASRDDGVYVIDDIGTEQSFTRVRRSWVVDRRPDLAGASVQCRATYRRGDWDVRVETDIELTCDRESFHFTARMATFDGGEPFVERHWTRTIARDHA